MHVDATVAVPRTDDLCSSGHVKNMSPPSTPLDQRVKPQFTSWLSEHFKQNGGQVKGLFLLKAPGIFFRFTIEV